jgi:hypothetical protein
MKIVIAVPVGLQDAFDSGVLPVVNASEASRRRLDLESMLAEMRSAHHMFELMESEVKDRG